MLMQSLRFLFCDTRFYFCGKLGDLAEFLFSSFLDLK